MKTMLLVPALLLVGLAAALPAAGIRRPSDEPVAEPLPPDTLDVATFAGGCFWCVEEAFDKVDGVVRTISGYTGGRVENPTYEQVSAGGTGHYEAVLVIYDPEVVSYDRLLEVFWRNVDPTDAGGQFCDRGPSYRTAVWYRDEEQRRLAEASKRAIELAKGFEVVTPILPAVRFYEAEEYHQNYHEKHPVRYRFYKWNCGRQQRLDEVWGER